MCIRNKISKNNLSYVKYPVRPHASFRFVQALLSNACYSSPSTKFRLFKTS